MQTLSVHDHHLGYFQTYTGRTINMRRPQISDIDIYDIAHALSHICRFGGHCNEFYSVAQHCVLASIMAPDELKLVALLHDAPEAYLGDVIKPLKVILGDEYSFMEELYMETILDAFQVPHFSPALYKEIKEIDYQLLEIENEAVRHNSIAGLQNLIYKSGFVATGWIWDSKTAKSLFIEAFMKYSNTFKALNS